MAEDMRGVVQGAGRIDGHHNGPNRDKCKIAERPLDSCAAENSDAVARCYARIEKSRGELVDPAAGFLPADGLPTPRFLGHEGRVGAPGRNGVGPQLPNRLLFCCHGLPVGPMHYP